MVSERTASALAFIDRLMSSHAEEISSQGTVSKRVSALEDHLGVQLLRRDQRNVTLTGVGESYLARCLRLLEEFDVVEASIQADATSPSGVVSITLSPVLSRLIVAPLLVEFLAEHPRIEVASFLTESHSDIIGEGIDVAMRARQLEDSSLIATRVSSNPLTLAAAPSYLQTSGALNRPEHLETHNCLTFKRMKSPRMWRFTQRGKVREVAVRGTLSASHSHLETMLWRAAVSRHPESRSRGKPSSTWLTGAILPSCALGSRLAPNSRND